MGPNKYRIKAALNLRFTPAEVIRMTPLVEAIIGESLDTNLVLPEPRVGNTYALDDNQNYTLGREGGVWHIFKLSAISTGCAWIRHLHASFVRDDDVQDFLREHNAQFLGVLKLSIEPIPCQTCEPPNK